ncbi:hypothetical protein AB838_20270 [Rhodobacteraceae bacterium (ex Bugula neritina AB1)]|nr:hypothetical protein AB838_20270 [Rhodobacteraceae bacterium (ex Bugula neritina AB1)]
MLLALSGTGNSEGWFPIGVAKTGSPDPAFDAGPDAEFQDGFILSDICYVNAGVTGASAGGATGAVTRGTGPIVCREGLALARLPCLIAGYRPLPRNREGKSDERSHCI